MKRSFLKADITEHEEEDYSPKLKLCKFTHPTVPEVLFDTTEDDETSCNTIVILDDSISSELLQVKYTSETLIISFLSNFETLLYTHDTNQLLNDQTLSNSIQRITNMYCTPPSQTDFSFLSNITEPAVILHWIELIKPIRRRGIVRNAYPFLSDSVILDENVLKQLLQSCFNLIIDDFDFENLDDSVIKIIIRSCTSSDDMFKICEKLTMNQILMLIESKADIMPYLSFDIVNDLQFWDKCKPYRAQIFDQNFKKLGIEIKNNKEIVLEWLQYQQCYITEKQGRYIKLYKQLSRELQKDVDICVAMVSDGTIPECLDEEMKTNRNVLLKATQSRYFNYEDLPKELKQDPEFLLQVVQHDSETFFKYNSNNDEKYLKRAVENSDGKLFKHLSESIRNDKELVMKLIEKPCWGFDSKCILENMGQELRNDKVFMLNLMKKDKRNFKYASESLRNDPELYNQVINKHNYFPKLYEFLPEHLKTHHVVLKHSLTRYYIDTEIIPPENIRNNKEQMMDLIWSGNAKSIYNYASNELKLDKEFVMKALHYDRGIEIDLNYWKDDLEVLLKLHYLNLGTLSEELSNNFNISVAAVINDAENINHVSDNLLNDIRFIETIFQRANNISRIIIHFPRIIFENKEIVKPTVKHKSEDFRHGFVFNYVDSDFEFMLSLIDRINPLQFASDELKNNKEFVETVLERHPKSFFFLSAELTQDCEFILNLVRKHPTKLDYLDLFTNCASNVIVRLVKEYPHLCCHVKSNFYSRYDNEKYFYEMSLFHFESFKQYLKYDTNKLPQHQQALKEHLRFKVNEKFKNSNSNWALKIWNQCSSLLKQCEDEVLSIFETLSDE